MASPKLSRGRISQIGSIFAVTVVTHDRAAVLADHSLAKIASSEISRCDDEGLVESHAWVIMPDHVHWLFGLRNGSMGNCLCAFKSRSARAINAMTRSRGVVWQPGYYDHRLRDDEDMLNQARYLVANPLRSHLASKIEDYPHWWCRWIKSDADL